MIPPRGAAAFLARHGHSGATIRPLAGDASFRRYFRVTSGGATLVLMDAPPAQEDSRPFLAITRHLRAIGFRAPELLGVDLNAGLILLEDFGDARMAETVAAEPTREEAIYAAAVDLLVELQRHAPPAGVAAYDHAFYRREVAIFTEWYLPAVGLAADEASYLAAWDAVLAPVLDPAEPVLVLRDYHAENIMLLDGGELGLLDFQGALAGHSAYDLVSLLQDARRDVSPALEAAMIARYRQQRALDPAHYAVLGAQRNAKILGIFARLARRDGKAGYLALQPRVWAYLERDLAHPALGPVTAWFDAHVPVDRRAAAWTEAAA